jgi:tetratricopeptide (TPR) repeat protein
MKLLISFLLCLILCESVLAEQPPRKRVESVRYANAKSFEVVQKLFETKDFDQVIQHLGVMQESDLNTIEKAYINNYYANVYFAKGDYALAIDAYEKTVQVEEGLPTSLIELIRDRMLPDLRLVKDKRDNALLDYERLRGLLTEGVSKPIDENYLTLATAAQTLNKMDEVKLLIKAAENAYGESSLPKNWFDIKTDLLVDAETDVGQKIELRKNQIVEYPSRNSWMKLLALYNARQKERISSGFYESQPPKVDPEVMTTYDQMYQLGFMQSASDYFAYMQRLFLMERYQDLIVVREAVRDKVTFKSTVSFVEMYAFALFKAEQWAQSINKYRELIQLKSDRYGGYHLKIGEAHQALNQFEEARLAYTVAVKIKSSKATAKQKIKELKKLKRKARKEKKKVRTL